MKALWKIALIIIYILCLSGFKAEKIDISNYEEKVLKSKEVWLLKYYSERCGSCQEFEPTWLSATKKIKKLKIGKVNIDEKSGIDLAMKNNILNEGIPQVKLVYGSQGQDVTIMAGDLIDEKTFLQIIQKNVNKFSKPSEGMYLKEDL